MMAAGVRVGIYNGMQVNVQHINTKHINLTKQDYVQLNQVDAFVLVLTYKE